MPKLGPIEQSVANPIADPVVMGSIPAWPPSFRRLVDNEIFSTVILLLSPSADSRRAVNCQLQVKVCALRTC